VFLCETVSSLNDDGTLPVFEVPKRFRVRFDDLDVGVRHVWKDVSGRLEAFCPMYLIGFIQSTSCILLFGCGIEISQ
jgi:hypothetical protein